MLRHQGFQGQPLNLMGRIKGAAGAQGAEDIHIEGKELLMLHQLPLGTPLKHRQLKTEQQIFEDGEIALGTLAGDLGFTGEGGRLSWLACEKLITSRKRLKSPICRTRASACTSSCRYSEA